MDNFYDKVKIIDKVLNSATCTRQRPCQSACNTCEKLQDSKEYEEDFLEYHFMGDVELSKNFPYKSDFSRYDVVTSKVNNNSLDRIQDAFIYVCAIIALSFNRVCDRIIDAFKKAYREKRL